MKGVLDAGEGVLATDEAVDLGDGRVGEELLL